MTPTLAVASHALRRATRQDRRTRAWIAATLFTGGRPPGSERLPSVRCSISRSREAGARSLDVHGPQPRTLSPDTDMSFLSPKNRRVVLPVLRHDPTFRPRPLRNGKMLLTDFCNPLKTRAPTDRSTPERTPFDVPTDERARARSVGAGPPCGEPTSGGDRLTASLQLRLTRTRCSRESNGPRRSRGISPRRCRPRARRTSSL
jgi:hypothetical protein